MGNRLDDLLVKVCGQAQVARLVMLGGQCKGFFDSRHRFRPFATMSTAIVAAFPAARECLTLAGSGANRFPYNAVCRLSDGA